MATIHAVDFERTGMAKGIKIASFVLILTAAALVTDHMGIVKNGPKQAVAQTASVQAVPALPAVDGFALPADLKPTQADLHEEAPTY